MKPETLRLLEKGNLSKNNRLGWFFVFWYIFRIKEKGTAKVPLPFREHSEPQKLHGSKGRGFKPQNPSEIRPR